MNTNKPLKLLVLADYKANTGFGTVSKNILGELKKLLPNLYLDIVAINYFGPMVEEDDRTTVVSAMKTTDRSLLPPGTKDEFGQIGFMSLLEQNDDYDGFFIIQDISIVQPMIPLLREVVESKKKKVGFKIPKSLIYFPVDAPMFPFLTQGLEFYDTLVTYNEWSREEVLKHNPGIRKKLKVVPHGIDPKSFYPLDWTWQERQEFRQQYFGVNNADKFIINATNRNQPRKDIPAVIFSFIEYKKKFNENSFLYLHMNPKDPLGWDLKAIMMQTDLREGIDYMFPPPQIENHGATVDLLNKTYNASDVFLTCNRGEGWGLSGVENMACKVPVIVPMHTSYFEITGHGSRAWVLEELSLTCGWTDNIIRPQVCIEEVAEKLDEVYQTKCTPAYNQKIEKAYQYASSLTWQAIAKRWEQIFRETF